MVDQRPHQRGADALSVEIVSHYEGDLGATFAVRVQRCVADDSPIVEPLLLDDRDDTKGRRRQTQCVTSRTTKEPSATRLG